MGKFVDLTGETSISDVAVVVVVKSAQSSDSKRAAMGGAIALHAQNKWNTKACTV